MIKRLLSCVLTVMIIALSVLILCVNPVSAQTPTPVLCNRASPNWNSAITFSPDGKYLLFATGNGVELWDSLSGQYIRAFADNGPAVFSPDGKHVATASGNITLWNTETGAREAMLQLDKPSSRIRRLAYVPDGTKIIASAEDQRIYRWDLATITSLTKSSATGYTFALSGDGSLWVVAGFNGAAVYRMDTGQVVSTIAMKTYVSDGSLSAIQDVAFSSDNKTVLIGSSDAALIDAQSGKLLHTLIKNNTVRRVAFSPNSKLAATIATELQIWDVQGGTLVETLHIPNLQYTTALNMAFSPDGTRIAATFDDGIVRVWDIASGKVINTLQHAPCPTPEPVLRPTLPPIAPDFWQTSGVTPSTLTAIGTHGDVLTLHADGSNRVQRTSYHYNDHVVLSPNGQWIAYRSIPLTIVNSAANKEEIYHYFYTDTRNLWVLNTQTWQATKLTDSVMDRSAPVWSLDSRKILFTEGKSQPRDQQATTEEADQKRLLIEIDVPTQSRRVIAPTFAINVKSPRYHPGGDGLAYIDAQGNLIWLDRYDKPHVIFQTDPKHQVHDFDWMPDGLSLVYVIADTTDPDSDNPAKGPAYSTWSIALENGTPRKLTDDLHDVSVSPDGKFLMGYVGSGYGDAGMVFLSVAFLPLAPDQNPAHLTAFGEFSLPSDIADHNANPQYPDTVWINGHTALGWYYDGIIVLIDVDHKQFVPIWQPETYEWATFN